MFKFFSLLVLLTTASYAQQVETIFTKIYETNYWGSKETFSGGGSEVTVTKNIRPEITALIERFQIKSIADAPCGDFNWMKLVDLGTCKYIGIDIVKALIDKNSKLFASQFREFKHRNLIEDEIDKVDLILCRDMLAHLTNEQIFNVLRNFKKSGSKYLLATTNIRTKENVDIQTPGDWRLLNLELPPFNFPKPLALIEEDVPFEGERGKHLGLWYLEDILHEPVVRKIMFQLKNEPIDVVIPSIEKDLPTLDLCIDGIKKNCVGIRDIYVVSKNKLTEKAIWIREDLYPFNKELVASAVFTNIDQREKYYTKNPNNRIGWIYQQLLKLYAPFVIPGISSNVLIVDSDTIFLNTTSFLNAACEPLFNPGSEYHEPYFEHASKLIPGFKRVMAVSGISHHMLFQRPVLESLFDRVEKHHRVEFWKAYCQCGCGENLVAGKGSPCAEYEIYFNYILATTNQAHVRELKWENVRSLKNIDQYKMNDYHYISAHTYMRD